MSISNPDRRGQPENATGAQLEDAGLSSAENEEATRRVRGVIEGRGLDAAFQPVVELETGSVAGYEALARFSAEPQRSPLQWFAEADQVGLGLDLEIAAISTAISRATRGEDHGEPLGGTMLGVNASPRAVVSGRLLAAVEAHAPQIPIVVEVTEHAGIEDYEAFQSAFSELRARGVKLAVDDVGAGYASLRHILQLGPESIKLDISLTRGIEGDRRKRALAAALISFAKETEAVIVAEGIESREELDALVSLGAEYGQGYYLARPGPLGRHGTPPRVATEAPPLRSEAS